MAEQTEQTETWEERKARLESTPQDVRNAQLREEYPHNHDVTGHFIGRESYTPDGLNPRDPLSGVYLSAATEPWHHFVGHPDYEPHPNSIAARSAAG